jgi:hypothetical protein
MNNLLINNAEDALRIGQIIARSGTFGCNSDEAGAVIALMCYQEGMGLFEFFRTYHIVDNKPTMRADAMLAKFLKFDWRYEVLERSETRAAFKVWRDDEPAKAKEYSLTMAEVEKAGYCFKKDGKTLTNNWQVRPKNMLWARLVSDTIRFLEPRVNAGIYTQEEQEEIGADTASHGEASAPKPLATQPQTTTTAPAPTPAAATPANPSNPDPRPSTPPKTSVDPSFMDPFAETGGTDYRKIPSGPHAGKLWTDLDHETLQRVKANPPAGVTKQHLEEVDAALDKIPF